MSGIQERDFAWFFYLFLRWVLENDTVEKAHAFRFPALIDRFHPLDSPFGLKYEVTPAFRSNQRAHGELNAHVRIVDVTEYPPSKPEHRIAQFTRQPHVGRLLETPSLVQDIH